MSTLETKNYDSLRVSDLNLNVIIDVRIFKSLKEYFEELPPKAVSSLQVVDVTEEYLYHLYDIETGTKYTFQDVFYHIWSNFPTKLRNEFQSWFLFRSNISFIKKKRRKAGCVFISANNKILFTVNQKEILQAPIGKESSKDGGSLKLTALREGLEETAIYLDQSEFYDNNQFFYHEGVRFRRKSNQPQPLQTG